MKEQYLTDTGFLFAVLDDSDEFHESCAEIYRTKRNMYLPEAVLPELAFLLFFLLLRENKIQGLINFLRYVADGNLPVVSTELKDLKRAAEILEKYADSNLDLVDCIIVAIAERLNIKKILTVDRRHFSIFRPRHCDYFEIAP